MKFDLLLVAWLPVAGLLSACSGGSQAPVANGSVASNTSVATADLVTSTVQLTGFASSPSAGQIVFKVDQPGKVSLAIYDSGGQMVRTLLNAIPYAGGSHQIEWDGKDDSGTKISGTGFTYKLLQTPGLRSEYLMTLQTTLPSGEGWVDRQVGVGNHDGMTAVTVDPTGVYIASGVSETTFNALKMTPDGKTRLWSAHQPDINMGRYAYASMGGQLYGLQQDAWVSYHGIHTPNGGWSAVGVTPSAVGNGDYIGVRWDALWPGAKRGDSGAWAGAENSMDLAAFDAGNQPQLAISYRDQNAVQWRNPSDGTVLDTATVSEPKGIAFDNNGSLLVLSGDRILRVSRANPRPQVVATGLTSPLRIDVDRSNGEMTVAETGSSQQIKRFSASGTLLSTHGRMGGRTYGLYEPRDFNNVNDVASDNAGGYWVTERSSPRRVAHFAGNGALIGEWYAGSQWAPAANPEPGNPSVVWMQSNYSDYIRATVDYASKSWKIHSIHPIVDSQGKGIHALGTGIDALKPRRVNGQLYLARDGGLLGVWIVDEVNWKVRAIASASFQYDNTQDSQGHVLWADENGDGLAQANEYRRFIYSGYYSNAMHNFRTDEQLNYYAMGAYGSIMRLPVKGWNAAKAPIYPDLNSLQNLGWTALPPEAVKAGGFSNNYASSHQLSFAKDGSVYGAMGIGDYGWASVEAAIVTRWNANGKLLWKRKLDIAPGGYQSFAPFKTYQPGSQLWSTFKNNVGVVYGNVVTQDFNGGHAGFDKQAITYVWNEDGLFVGGLFDIIDTSKVGVRYYNLSSENGAGALFEDASNGTVVYFGGTESANHVYRVRGWSGWLRLNGSITIN